MGSYDKCLYEVIATCQKHSVPHNILDRQQVFDKFSSRFDIPNNWVGMCTSDGAIQNGIVLRDYMEVKDIRKDDVKGGVWVYTSNGEKFWDKKCVVTVGA
ncbi:hypothetical protein SO802_033479 [Lithocarpus litseifolius]|uniref:Uncharacterized protein n=1 Tax=Lithocarpus litseifolius TaxID=425828 RepID=A0AAW2BG31_9ROSI